MQYDTDPERGIRSRQALFPVAILCVAAFTLQFLFRAYDDNRLTSWQWVFQEVNAVRIFVLLVAGVAAAAFVPWYRWAGRMPSLFLSLFSFGAGLLFWREPEVIVDAARYFTQAKHLELHGPAYFLREWGHAVSAWTDMPLLPFAYGLIFTLFGESRLAIQTFTTALFSATVVLTYLTGRLLWGERVGMYAGGLLLGMPYLFTQVPLMLVDVPAMFFLLLSLYTFLQALNRAGLWIPAAAGAFVLAFFAKYSLWLMLSVLPVAAVVLAAAGPVEASFSGTLSMPPYRTVFRRALHVMLSAGICIGVAGIFLQDVMREQIGLLLSYQKPGLDRWGESFLSTFLFQVHPFLAIAAVASVFTAIRTRDVKYIIAAWLVVVLLILQVRRIRYLVPVFPMFAILAAYGVATIRRSGVADYVVACTVVSSLVVGAAAYRPFLMTISPVNLTHAGAYLDRLDADALEVHAFAASGSDANPDVSVPILDLFTRKEVFFVPDPRPIPPADHVETSSLRFTWDFRVPAYYRSERGVSRAEALVVIYGDRGQQLPAGLQEKTRGFPRKTSFTVRDDLFEYQTLVDVYHR